MESHYYLEQVLRSLSKYEHKCFKKFLNSPYFIKKHSRNKASCKFYELLKGYLHKKSINDNEYLKIVRGVYKHISYDIKLFHKMLTELKSDLYYFLLDFLAIESFKKDKFYFNLVILNELEKRKLPDNFEHFCRANRFRKSFNGYKDPLSSCYYWKIFQLANKHRERNLDSVNLSDNPKTQKLNPCESRGDLNNLHNTNGKETWYVNPDYETEKLLLRKYLISEIKDFRARMRIN